MPQDQTVPTGPQGETTKPTDQQKPVDIQSILLPKKEVHAPENAERINAGVLLEQEKTATLPVPPKPTPAPAPEKKEEPVVQPLQTYQGDIEGLVQHKNVSVVSIAAAEAGRRSGEALPSAEPERDIKALLTRIGLIGGGILLLLAAATAIAYVLRPAPSVQVTVDTTAPFITVDETKAFVVPEDSGQHAAALAALDQQRQNISLSLGLIARIFLTPGGTSTGSTLAPLKASQVLTLLSPRVPDTLTRAVDSRDYLLGIHSYDGNQPFLILKTNAYEQAFSGMLAWEPYIKQDLSPLFSRTPPVTLNTPTTASSTATSTPPLFGDTTFVDRIVENQDARVIESANKDILLLWTFINRTTVVITTNEATLREIISRVKNAPIVPNP